MALKGLRRILHILSQIISGDDRTALPYMEARASEAWDKGMHDENVAAVYAIAWGLFDWWYEDTGRNSELHEWEMQEGAKRRRAERYVCAMQMRYYTQKAVSIVVAHVDGKGLARGWKRLVHLFKPSSPTPLDWQGLFDQVYEQPVRKQLISVEVA
jgi:hypothetical protein